MPPADQPISGGAVLHAAFVTDPREAVLCLPDNAVRAPLVLPDTPLLPAARRPAPAPEPPTTTSPADADQLVRALLSMTHRLVSTADAAAAVLGSAMTLLRAESGAVLVSDGLEWRIAADVGLSPAERRVRLPESHWAIDAIERGKTPHVVTRGDRHRVVPVPFSGEAHLLLAPLRRAPALIVLARARPFSDADVRMLGFLPADPVTQVGQSLQVRALARALDGLRDLP